VEQRQRVLEALEVLRILVSYTATGAASGWGAPRPVMARNVSWSEASREPPYSSFSATGVPSAMRGRAPAQVSREALVPVDDIEDLLSDRVLGYAVRG
jgi:hypothetical protein